MYIYDTDLLINNTLFNNIPLDSESPDLKVFVDYYTLLRYNPDWFLKYKTRITENLLNFQRKIFDSFELSKEDLRNSLFDICKYSKEAKYYRLGYSKCQPKKIKKNDPENGKGLGVKMLWLVDRFYVYRHAIKEGLITDTFELFSMIPEIGPDCISDLILSLNYSVFSDLTKDFINEKYVKKDIIKSVIVDQLAISEDNSIISKSIEINCFTYENRKFLITPQDICISSDISKLSNNRFFKEQIFPNLSIEMKQHGVGGKKISQKEAIDYFIDTRFSKKGYDVFDKFSEKKYSNPNKHLLYEMLKDRYEEHLNKEKGPSLD